MFNMELVWVSIILLVIVLIYYATTNASDTTDNLSAREILDIKFANGDIDEEEYRTKKALLKK